MRHTDENDWTYFDSLEEIEEEGYKPIRVWNPLQFFTLRGRTTKLAKENLIPIPELQYVVLTLAENKRYYLRTAYGYSVDELFFYRRTIDFSGDSPTIDTLHRYIYDDRVWLLFTPQMVEDTKKMLERVCRAYVNGEAHLSYKTYIDILEGELKLEDYRDYAKNLTGFRTGCHIQDEGIRELWKKCIKK